MLHVIYRSYGGENVKNRPAFYSKRLALASFVRAVEEAGVPIEVLYLNDGPIPADRLALMDGSGETIARFGLGNKGSVRAALALPLERGWPDEDIVWLAEDDYLYDPAALVGLAAAPGAFPTADYFALYASVGHRPPAGGAQPDYAPVPPTWEPSAPVSVAGRSWQRGLSTTGTYGVTVRALREDQRLLRWALWSGAGWDHTMCLLYQGYQPFTWRAVADQARAGGVPGPLSLARRGRFALLAAVRAALNGWRLVRRGPRRLLVTADPALVTHLEVGCLALGTDWAGLADDCTAWAAARDVPGQPVSAGRAG